MLFSNPEMRAAFIELHGTDKPGAKFKIGQRVRFDHKLFPETLSGTVQAVNHADGNFEYLIEGAFVLAWESQLRSV